MSTGNPLVLLSGSVFLQPFQIASGAILSGSAFFGSASYTPIKHKCVECSVEIDQQIDYNVRTFYKGSYIWYCFECLGLDNNDKKVPIKKDWILDSVPFNRDAPLYMIADWLEEQGRDKDAGYIRKLMKRREG